MSNPEWMNPAAGAANQHDDCPECCCVLGICCDPVAQRAAIVRELVGAGVEESAAGTSADAMMKYLNPRVILKAIENQLQPQPHK